MTPPTLLGVTARDALRCLYVVLIIIEASSPVVTYVLARLSNCRPKIIRPLLHHSSPGFTSLINHSKMKRISSSSAAAAARLVRTSCPQYRVQPCLSRRSIQVSTSQAASVAPITAAGPPPEPPTPEPAAINKQDRIARKKKQSELLKSGQNLKGLGTGKGGSAATKRFWKDVNIKKVDGGYQVLLDARPVRTPDKDIITIPETKPHLADAIALEWDSLVASSQALKYHLIPMTSLVSRALDIQKEDQKNVSGSESIRNTITKTVMRYLETDSILCWAPTPPEDPPGYETHVSRIESLREIQQRTALPIIQYLTERVWPGVEIIPVLDEGSIMPKPQPQETLDVIKGWIMNLPAFELAGLERAVLAGKGLLVAARLIVEWSEEFAHLREGQKERTFGLEKAAEAATHEVEYQLGMWGVVEDTHDVDREDVRRQMGSAILLVSGDKA